MRTVPVLLVACAVAAPGMSRAQSAEATPAEPMTAETLDAIVVTATKRPERVREIAGSVTAFNEGQLESLGAQSFADYLTRTPGVVFNQTVPGNSAAILRGVATTTGISQAQGTTGYFINDVPLTDPFYSGGIPDIDTFDVDNVAVLRGPQGTLFGSSSLGGAINYQAARPDLAAPDLHLRGTWSDTRHGGTGYNAGVMANVPLATDAFAVRGVFTRRRVAGFVDNVGTGERDSNRTDIEGGRVLATWKPADATTLNYLFLQQESETDDAGSTEPAVGRYAKRTVTPEPFRYETRLHNLRLDQGLGGGTLTATATSSRKTFSGDQDYSGFVPAFLQPARFLEPGTIRGDTYEARYASPAGQRFEFLFGAFHNDTRERIRNLLETPDAGPILGTTTALDALAAIDAQETALFGEASYRLTDAFKLTLGGRAFRTRLDSTTTTSGPLVGGTDVQVGKSRESGFNPKASLAWQPDKDQMLYALVSRGFRFGGPNVASAADPTIPEQFDSDSLVNYELGSRSTFNDGRLLLDGTLYWIDWQDIQFSQRAASGLVYTANAGRARNRGVEAGITSVLTPSLSVRAAATYLDAELRSDYGSGAALVPAGSRLPGASRWQWSGALTYAPDTARFAPTFSLAHRYVSSAPGELTPNPRMQGGYHLVDMRAGVVLDRFEVSVFVDNVADKRGVSQAATGIRGPVEFLVMPRTFGLTVDYRL